MGLFTLLARCWPLARRRCHAARLEATTLSPLQLERRRVLDAAGAGLVIGPLIEPSEFVQAGEPVNAQSANAQSDGAPVAISPGVAEGVIALNSPPTITDIFTVSGETVENGIPVGLFVSFSDLDRGDTHTVKIDWGDGTAVETITLDQGSRSLFTSHQYLDDNPTATPVDTNYNQVTVQVTVIDSHGASAMGMTPAIVSNADPQIDFLSVTSPVNENGIAQLQMSFTDQGILDTHTVEIDWGDGSPVEPILLNQGTRSLVASHQYLDDNPTNTLSDINQVVVKVIDDDMGTDMATHDVLVNNVAPTIDTLSITTPINENNTATLTGTYSDPGTLDTFELDIDWDGDSNFDETVTVSGGSFSVAHQYFDDNPTNTSSDTFDVMVRLRDDDSGIDTDQVALTVDNVSPSDIQITPLVMIDENGIAQLQMSFVDPGILDTHTVDIDWDGDNVFDETIVVSGGAFMATHQFLDDDPTGTLSDTFNVNVRLRDDDTGEAVASVPLTINNVVPNLAISVGQMVNEGALLDLTGGGLGSFTDVGTLDAHTATVSWGDGTPIEAVVVNQLAGSGTLDASHIYADDGLYTVTVTVTDDDGGVGVQTFLVTVKNVDPPIDPIPDVEANEGEFISLPPANFEDPGFDFGAAGTEENFTATIDWGDGSSEPISDITVMEVPGSPGVLTTGMIDAEHAYADDGIYTVTIRLFDDDGGMTAQTFQVTVKNVAPSLTGEDQMLIVNEGEEFTFSDLGIGLDDPGFDNPLNPLPGGELAETFTGMSIDWGDGSAGTPVSAVNRLSGSEGVRTTADFVHAAHAYADDGTYLVIVTFADDDGGSTAGAFEIVVLNVAPSLSLTDRSLEIDEGETLTLPDLGVFSDPGFNNLLNPNGASVESFSYEIDWGDGTSLEAGVLPASVVDGSQGVLTTGLLVDSHFYADNDVDNQFTILVTLRDDDGGTVTKSIVVTVLNVNPALDPIGATDVNFGGTTTLDLEFLDPGADVFEVLVDWGDQLGLPPGDRFVVETVYVGPTPESFTIVHQYTGPPDPSSPAADILITVKILDDDFGTTAIDIGQSNLESVAISNPGLGTTPIRIDTTPQVPRLIFPARTESTLFFEGPATTEGLVRGADLRSAAGDTKAANQRFLELRVISSSGEMSEGIRLKSEVLSDLPGLFRRLADNRYAIYLVRTETNTRRLVIEFFVRNGRAIDPGDDSEGTRDRPPTDDASQQPLQLQPIAPAAEEGDSADPEKSAATSDLPEDLAAGDSLSWSPLIGTALVASSSYRSWAEQVDRTVASAGTRAWRRLRTNHPSKRKNR